MCGHGSSLEDENGYVQFAKCGLGLK